MIRVCIAGATEWAGSELARAVGTTADLTLVSAVSRTHARHTLGQVLNEPDLAAPVFASVTDALAVPCDVVVEYTKPEGAKTHILAALNHGRNTAAAADLWALVPAVGQSGNGVPLKTFAELLAGIGRNGSRAHTLQVMCVP